MTHTHLLVCATCSANKPSSVSCSLLGGARERWMAVCCDGQLGVELPVGEGVRPL